ncbi:MAG: adenosylcobalamin-dependent ribonucleoside-diphosphate reductase [Rhodospirillaceae bacterium]|nr:MAG: adenosylcobalamin-dependent ribonucleoside-diphosphate reductase [Rhodospirillaceae bacterium]
MDPLPIAGQIWDMKYRFKDADGRPVDATVNDTWWRVARALAASEREPALWAERFHRAMADYGFLPAGRILAGAGTGRTVTLHNCFVMGTIADDMGSIFAHLREAALTMQQGGGIGYDFSTLRPRGAPVKGVGADASGPLSFMDVWDAMCRTIMSAGSRRGAMMATLRCDHPDIEEFVSAKQTAGRLTNFNLSVLVTDAYMAAVKNDADWPLIFGGEIVRTVRARDLWHKIMHATYEYSEPGVIFIDRINARNNLYYCEQIAATNPCGEQPLPPYGTCLLGSINLARLVRAPFSDQAHLDTSALGELAAVAVRMMDNVIEASKYPVAEQRREAEQKRRIGLGITGLADALIMCGLRYGSDEAVATTRAWAAAFRDAAVAASIDLAREKGPFPLFDRDKYLAGPTVAALPKALRDGIAAHGIRNALVTSIAPTGTISLFADNVSSGLEPVFSFAYTRRVTMPDGNRREEEVSDYAFRLFRSLMGPDAPLPAAFVDAQNLLPDDHLVMQAAVQDYVDSSISKTINIPEDLPFAAFADVYLKAYAMGCKGCTTYRPSAARGAVMEVKKDPPAKETPRSPATSALTGQDVPMARPETLPGATYKLNWPETDHAIYITVNDILVEEAPGRFVRRPFEVFINSKNMEHYAWTVALTRMISAVFRRGGDISFVVEELKAVFDPRGGQWMNGRYVPSLLAAIGDVIARHMIEIGFMPVTPVKSDDTGKVVVLKKDATKDAGPRDRRFRACPKCGTYALLRQEGCDSCTSCGFSKCS